MWHDGTDYYRLGNRFIRHLLVVISYAVIVTMAAIALGRLGWHFSILVGEGNANEITRQRDVWTFACAMIWGVFTMAASFKQYNVTRM